MNGELKDKDAPCNGVGANTQSRPGDTPLAKIQTNFAAALQEVGFSPRSWRDLAAEKAARLRQQADDIESLLKSLPLELPPGAETVMRRLLLTRS